LPSSWFDKKGSQTQKLLELQQQHANFCSCNSAALCTCNSCLWWAWTRSKCTPTRPSWRLSEPALVLSYLPYAGTMHR
jgi:hypothetical protein